ncbi:MAG: endolytic transglycosylase MltG [Pseudomonadota bacterium]
MSLTPGHLGRTQRGGIVARLLITLFVIAAIGAGLAGYAGFEAKKRMSAAGPLAAPQLLWVQRGDTVSDIARRLSEEGAISAGDPKLDVALFKLAARLEVLAPHLKAGEYEIPAEASILEIVALLKEGKALLRFVTIPEGLTTAMIIKRIEAVELLEGKVTLLIKEGDLLPETYSYQRGETRDSLLLRMQKAHNEVLEELWVGRQADLPVKTPQEAVILASIVEKETGIAEERPRVAAVFVNRLRRGMRLQSDPTIIYGLTGGEPLGRGIRRSELRKETPYNTYVIRGLPPTPIANPGRDALAAVLNPLETKDLYFVADGTGGHVFAKSLAEHNRNVAQWRKIERTRNATN